MTRLSGSIGAGPAGGAETVVREVVCAVYFEDAVRVLLRRWYVVVAGLLLTAIAATAAIFLVPTDYQASGEMLLLLPADVSSDGVPVNPYLNLPPALSVTASLIAGNVMSKGTQRDIADAGFTSSYSVALSPGAGPLLELSTQDTNQVAALATLHELIRRMSDQLDQIQAEKHVAVNQLIQPTPVNVSSKAEVLPGSKIRALAIIGAVGMLVTLLSAFMLDRVRSKRRRDDVAVDEIGLGKQEFRASRNGGDSTVHGAPGAQTPRRSRGNSGVEAAEQSHGVSQTLPKHGRREQKLAEMTSGADQASTHRGIDHPSNEAVERGRGPIRMGLSAPRNDRSQAPAVNGRGGEAKGVQR
jgi:hypothetical protein